MQYQALSLIGAVLVLGAYLANHRGWIGPRDRAYNLMNFAGAALLAVVAVVDRRVGFIVLEGVWVLIALPALLRPPQRAGVRDVRPNGDGSPKPGDPAGGAP